MKRTGHIWRLEPAAYWFLTHVALLAASGSISGLLFNVAILQLGYERTFLGLLDTVAMVSAALLSLPLWALAARIGPRRSLLVNGIARLGFALAMALWPRPSVLVVVVAVVGATSVLYEVSAAPLMMRYTTGDTRDSLFSANAAVALCVAGVATLAAGQLPAVLGQWLNAPPESPAAYRAAFLVSAIGYAAALVPVFWLRPASARTPAPASTPARPSLQFTALLRQLVPLLPLLLTPALISLGAALLIPYLNLFFKERFQLDDGTLGLIFALLGLGAGGSTMLAPALARRYGRMPAIVLTEVVSLPFLAILATVANLPLAVLAALLRSALFNLGTPLYEAFAMERTPEHLRTTQIGLLNGAQTAGYIIAPGISTWVQTHYGFGPLFIATGTCYALAALLNYLLFVHGRQQHSAVGD